MVRDPYASEEPPAASAVLEALSDEDARAILRTLTEPMTAQEIQAECDIPESTLYRKLDKLTETGLLTQQTRIRRNGHHANEYAVAFSAITVTRDDEDGELLVDIVTPARTADERLAELWTEVGREV